MYGLKHSHTNISELLLSNIIWVPVALAIGVGFWYFGKKTTAEAIAKSEEQLLEKELENNRLQQKITECKEKLDQTQNNFVQQTEELNILKEQLKNIPITYEEILEKYEKSPQERETLFNYLKEDPDFKAYYKGRGFNEVYENTEFYNNFVNVLREKNVDPKYMDAIMDRMYSIGEKVFEMFAQNDMVPALLKMQREYSKLLNITFDFFINWHIDNNLEFDYKNFKYPALEGTYAGVSQIPTDCVEMAYELIKLVHGIH